MFEMPALSGLPGQRDFRPTASPQFDYVLMRETEMTANSTTQDDWGLWGERFLKEVLSELRSRGSKGEQGMLGWGSWRRKP